MDGCKDLMLEIRMLPNSLNNFLLVQKLKSKVKLDLFFGLIMEVMITFILPLCWILKLQTTSDIVFHIIVLNYFWEGHVNN